MGRYLLFLVFIVISAGIEASPQISPVGAVQVDFGRHPAKDPKEASFAIKNTGDEPLSIKGVNKTCGGCVEISVSEKELYPGKTADIKITLVPFTLSGSYAKNFFVETNDPAQRFLMFTFSGTAVPVAEIKPSNLLYIGKINTGAIPHKYLIM